MTIIEIFNNIANSIRNKLGTEDKILPSNMSNEIDKISATGEIITMGGGYVLEITTYPNSTVTASRIGNTTKTTTSDSNGKAYLIFNSNDDNGDWDIRIGFNNGANIEYYNTTFNWSLYLRSSMYCKYTEGIRKYIGTVSNLSNDVVYASSATSINNYAIFAGGHGPGSTYLSTVDTYTNLLVKGTITDLEVARGYLTSTTIGNYALFGGGYTSSSPSAKVDAYDSNLTKSLPAGLHVQKYDLAATSIGNYAIFAGGREQDSDGDPRYTTPVDTYNSSLTKVTASDLDYYRSQLAATSVGSYALFACGYTTFKYGGPTTYYKYLEAYSNTLTHQNTSAMSQERSMLAATTLNNYAIFAGGADGTSVGLSKVVDACDNVLSTRIVGNLATNRCGLAGTTVGNYAIFAGGHTTILTPTIIDASLAISTCTDISVQRDYAASATVGNYAIFNGGNNSTVDVYTVS